MSVDQELQAALDVEPSPEFVARVRERIASEPAPHRWGLWWLMPAAAFAAALIVAVLFAPRPRNIAPPRSASIPLPPASTAVSSAEHAFVPRPRPTDVTARRVRRPRSAGARAANEMFVIDAAEARALRRLVFGPPLQIDQPYVGTTLAAIEIAPISIQPLPIGGEGVRQ